eukprot:Gb_03709 [translate_table: standard]
MKQYGVLFYPLASTASEYLCCSVEKLCGILGMSLALIALGNGASDMFSSIVAFMSGTGTGNVGVSSVLGGAMFVSTVVVGLVSIYEKVYLWEASAFLSIYRLWCDGCSCRVQATAMNVDMTSRSQPVKKRVSQMPFTRLFLNFSQGSSEDIFMLSSKTSHTLAAIEQKVDLISGESFLLASSITLNLRVAEAESGEEGGVRRGPGAKMGREVAGEGTGEAAGGEGCAGETKGVDGRAPDCAWQ